MFREVALIISCVELANEYRVIFATETNVIGGRHAFRPIERDIWRIPHGWHAAGFLQSWTDKCKGERSRAGTRLAEQERTGDA